VSVSAINQRTRESERRGSGSPRESVMRERARSSDAVRDTKTGPGTPASRAARDGSNDGGTVLDDVIRAGFDRVWF
jgi:hypothetical protein